MMSNSPLLSVIVPVYNTAPWLRRCLDSICAQSYRNLEILCVNDGSTDNSAEILTEYAAKDERIKVFTQANAGLSAARNTALDHATGEWVTGVDSDDYLYPGVYEHAVACISTEVDMVFFGVQEVAEDGTPLPHNGYFDLPAAGQYKMTPELAEKLNVCFWSKLWRRSMMEDNGLRFPHRLVHEDEAMFYLACPYVRLVALCPAMGYAYMQREGSIMKADGLTEVRRLMRYVPVWEYTCREYANRAWLNGANRAYLVKLLLRTCQRSFWLVGAEADELRTAESRIICRYALYRDDYRLERLIPVPRWQSLFLSRYEKSKVYRVLGVAWWAVFYSDSGVKIGSQCLIFDQFKKIFR